LATDEHGLTRIGVPLCSLAANLLWNFDHMTHGFDVVIERDEEGFYVASVPELHGCHTQARSLDALRERIREVIELCLEVQRDLPASVRLI
jgi:predicted RNase H-like HicB family nuclease